MKNEKGCCDATALLLFDFSAAAAGADTVLCCRAASRVGTSDAFSALPFGADDIEYGKPEDGCNYYYRNDGCDYSFHNSPLAFSLESLLCLQPLICITDKKKDHTRKYEHGTESADRGNDLK